MSRKAHWLASAKHDVAGRAWAPSCHFEGWSLQWEVGTSKEMPGDSRRQEGKWKSFQHTRGLADSLGKWVVLDPHKPQDMYPRKACSVSRQDLRWHCLDRYYTAGHQRLRRCQLNKPHNSDYPSHLPQNQQGTRCNWQNLKLKRSQEGKWYMCGCPLRQTSQHHKHRTRCSQTWLRNGLPRNVGTLRCRLLPQYQASTRNMAIHRWTENPLDRAYKSFQWNHPPLQENEPLQTQVGMFLTHRFLFHARPRPQTNSHCLLGQIWPTSGLAKWQHVRGSLRSLETPRKHSIALNFEGFKAKKIFWNLDWLHMQDPFPTPKRRVVLVTVFVPVALWALASLSS